MPSKKPAEAVKEHVRETYGKIAQGFLEGTSAMSCCATASCCQGPTGCSLGSGDPISVAGLKLGQTVLDLGSGAGLDCLTAATIVGPQGHVIGVDMTSEMVALANENARRSGFANIEFRLGEIERLPVDDGQVDAVVSNCVINLSPDKSVVFTEAFRVLKPGGVLTISDIVTHGQLPSEVKADPQAWSACVAGALEEAEYLECIRKTGFRDVQVLDRAKVPWGALEKCCSSDDGAADEKDEAVELLSVTVVARKPAS